MSFSIQTNVNSIIAQENLRVNSNFQSQTIQRLTSGYRINQSGDDAAGLAVANKFRSDVSELTQGVRNANDGVSQLQIMDGGMNNVAKMLDRLKTLATQSASDTFTGDRKVLNKEYQTLVGEIDRQAQAIGLSSGGHFARSMGVFIGGGTTAAGAIDTGNGTVSLDLTNSVVDSKALGLRTTNFATAPPSGTNLALASTTSVANILAANAGDTGKASFELSGAGFSNMTVSVTITATDTTSTLADKLNVAIQSLGNSTATGAANLAAANIKAQKVTGSDGSEQLTFTSATGAFQVAAGTNTANALLGKFDPLATNVATGASVKQVVNSGVAVAATVGAEAGLKLTLVVNGTKTVISQALAGPGTAAANELLFTAGANYNTALAAGVKIEDNGSGGLKFTGTSNQSIQVSVEGDTQNALGLGSWSAVGDNVTSVAVATAFAAGVGGETETIGFSINGGDTITVQVAQAGTIAGASTNLQNAINANADLKAAGLTVSAAGAITSGAAGVTFRASVEGRSGTFDMGYAVALSLGASTANFKATDKAAMITAGGSAQTGLGTNNEVFSFAGLKNAGAQGGIAGAGADQQVISFTTTDDAGKVQTVSKTLSSANAGDVDTAVATLNTALQADTTLKNVVAVKETNSDGTSEGIRFISSLDNFSVNVGKATNDSASYHVGIYDGTAGATATQGMTVQSSSSGTVDISSKAGAKQAVVTLGAAVATLGTAQAAIGKGQNQLNYAISLAQSQIGNFSAAQAQIRDSDVAAEAANLTKAQVLQQASIAAMAQANSAPQAVLSLLRG